MRPGAPSLNPRGRPRKGASLAERVRALVDPDELIELLLTTARSEDTPYRERLQAASMLWDRGWGRPLQQTELDIRVTTSATPILPYDWDQLTDGQRTAWLDGEMHRRALGAGDGDGGDDAED